MECCPGDEEGHHHRLACARREFHRVAQEVAGFRHLAAPLCFIKKNDGFDRFLLAKEEVLPDSFPLLVTLEPPFEQTPAYGCRTGITVFAPGANFIAKLVDEIVLLGC